MENLAVQCKTQDEWDMVMSAIPISGRGSYKYDCKYNCIGMEGGINLEVSGSQSKEWYEGKSRRVISAAEYLNEGGKDVKQFEVGDRVECVEAEGAISSYDLPLAGKYIIAGFSGPGIRLKGETGAYCVSRFKLATKPKTTKENNMNISDNILEVFTTSKDAKKVANRFGDQYGNTERDLLALRRDKVDLLAIINDEEDEAKEVKKKK